METLAGEGISRCISILNRFCVIAHSYDTKRVTKVIIRFLVSILEFRRNEKEIMCLERFTLS